VKRVAGVEDMNDGDDGVSEVDLSVWWAVCWDAEQSRPRHPLLDEREGRVGMLLSEQVMVQVHCESPKRESIYDESIE
jgi:hypothetical protein